MDGVSRERADGGPVIRVERKGAMQTPLLAVPPRTVADNAAVLVSDQHRTSHVALLAALLIGALARGWHVWGVDFPLNDGGLFYAMVRDIQHAHYHLPAFTSYNGAHIPFGYSPLGFYLAGVLNDRGVDLLTLFRILPFAASTACIPAFYLLAREMLRSRAALSAALIAFAIVPRGFVWLLMGGGLTRSFGYLFALLALHQIWLLYTRRSLRHVPLATLFSALTVLSHLGTAPFVAFSALLFLLFRGRHREGVLGSVLIGAGALVLTAPWWATVISMHGIGPFLAARATGGSIFSDVAARHGSTLGVFVRLVFGNTGEGYFPVIWILALLGVVWCVRERRALLPVWWAMILLLDTRAGSTYAAAPVAMLAGISSVHLIWPLLRRRERDGSRGAPRPLALAAVGVIVLASIVAAASSRGIFRNESGVLTALGPRDRAAMQWMAVHTDTSARVLVLTSSPWQIDKVSEWFPVLASRTSLATVQGSEWLPHRAFYTFIARQQRVASCAKSGTTCLDSLRENPSLQFTHVYVPNGVGVRCCRLLLEALREDPRYQVIHDDSAATIFARR
ncbi:MAG TPA: hypothetical protein VGJ12_03430 [Gemmatimonadaceae bacterium]